MWIQRQGVSTAAPLDDAESGCGPLGREGLSRFAAPAPDRVMPAPWHDMLRACSAVEVFDFFHSAGLATHSYRHHCLAALRRKSFSESSPTACAP
jgi:hypothetical protein